MVKKCTNQAAQHCFLSMAQLIFEIQHKSSYCVDYRSALSLSGVVAGVEGGRLVEAHGSFSTASCTHCHSKQDPLEVKVHTCDTCNYYS